MTGKYVIDWIENRDSCRPQYRNQMYYETVAKISFTHISSESQPLHGAYHMLNQMDSDWIVNSIVANQQGPVKNNDMENKNTLP